MRLRKRHWGFSPAVLATVLVSCAVAAFVQTRKAETAAWLGGEDGPFEKASVAFYAVALALTARPLLHELSGLRLSAAVMLFWAALRELDFQKRYTYRSIESLGFYTRPDAELHEKLIALLALAPFALAGVYLLLGFLKRVRTAWARGEVWAGHAFAAIALMLMGSVLEKVFGFHAAEEILETGMGFVILLLAWELRGRKAPDDEGLSTRDPAAE